MASEPAPALATHKRAKGGKVDLPTVVRAWDNYKGRPACPSWVHVVHVGGDGSDRTPGAYCSLCMEYGGKSPEPPVRLFI